VSIPTNRLTQGTGTTVQLKCWVRKQVLDLALPYLCDPLQPTRVANGRMKAVVERALLEIVARETQMGSAAMAEMMNKLSEDNASATKSPDL
jgi:hypothetical protein